MVHREINSVVIRIPSNQTHAKQRSHVEVKGAANIFGGESLRRSFAFFDTKTTQIHERQGHQQIRFDSLYDISVDHGKRGAPDLMTPDNLVEAAPENGRIQRSAFVNSHRLVIKRHAGGQPVVKPNLFLSGRKWSLRTEWSGN